MAEPDSAIILRHGPLECAISPQCGGSIIRLLLHRDDQAPLHLMRPAQPGAVDRCEPADLSCHPLVPFSNRIAGGHFVFHGRSVDLPPNAPFIADVIHGHGWQAPWTVSTQDGSSAVMTFDYAAGTWPYAYSATQRFQLADDRLTIAMELVNTGDLAMPAGLGLHPYFPKPIGTRLTADLDGVWLGDEGHIPTERVPLPLAWDFPHGVALDDIVLDNNFTGWNGRARIDWPGAGASLRIEATPPFRHAVVYVPHNQDYFCFEPVSHMTNAVNRAAAGERGTGFAELAPGDSFGGSITFAVELSERSSGD
ncbi:aldose 1-epimerase [Skermanella mucosa]|uniref:aldose 1-epimerase n=1 Tax=Skermanella mucosa TaxID=1789672 RepID=UPI00192C1D1E|nr:aldose 1-epimerase [Skermanella mucosa]UEM23355.1 aldose 1-epimerase [Skermanella mucosa]